MDSDIVMTAPFLVLAARTLLVAPRLYFFFRVNEKIVAWRPMIFERVSRLFQALRLLKNLFPILVRKTTAGTSKSPLHF